MLSPHFLEVVNFATSQGFRYNTTETKLEESEPFNRFCQGYFCVLFATISTGILRLASHKKLGGLSNIPTHEGRVSFVWSVLWGKRGASEKSNLLQIFI